MGLVDVSDHTLISDNDVLEMIRSALQQRLCFSLVRIGDGENLVLAQDVVLCKEEVLKTRWSQLPDNGVPIPHSQLRREVIQAIKTADVVGVLRNDDEQILAPKQYKRELTNKIFDAYNLNPQNLCSACINRNIITYPGFWEILHQKRTLLISKWAFEYARIIEAQYAQLPPKIAGCICLTQFEQIPQVLNEIGKYAFDLALVSAGINAVILSPKIANYYGKVAIDFGKAMMYTVQSSDRIAPWSPRES